MKTAPLGPVGASLSSAAPKLSCRSQAAGGGRRGATLELPVTAGVTWINLKDSNRQESHTAMQDISLPVPVRQRYFFLAQ